MSQFICKNCQALLAAGNVYCLNCGTPVAASVDDEQQTVIRRQPLASTVGSLRRRLIGVFAALLIGVVVIGGLLFGYSKYLSEKELKDYSEAKQANAAKAAANAAAAAANTIAAVNAAGTPQPTRERSASPPVPTKTPIDVDRMRADIDAEITEREERERRQRERNIANAVNAMRQAANRAAPRPFNAPPGSYYDPRIYTTNRPANRPSANY